MSRTDGAVVYPGFLPGMEPQSVPMGGAIPGPVEEQPRRRYQFYVPGEPKPMGSKTAFVVGSRAVITDGKNAKPMRAWQGLVIEAANAQIAGGQRITGPVAVRLEFYLARPGGHHGARGLKPSAPLYPAVKPDLDKLARSTLDGLAVALLADDSRVVQLRLAKWYADAGPTGCSVVVEELP